MWFNRYSNAYAASFVFESMSLIFILSLFACGYTITVREFKNIQNSLNLAAKRDSKISAKAHILEQGVQDMSDILSKTTAIVFVAFVIQTCYDLLWTTATFGDVFKIGCKWFQILKHSSSLCNSTHCLTAGFHPCEHPCYALNGVLNHAIRYSHALISFVYLFSLAVSPLAAIFGMTKGRIWYVYSMYNFWQVAFTWKPLATTVVMAFTPSYTSSTLQSRLLLNYE